MTEELLKLADLKPKQGKVNIEAEVVDKGEPREFSKFGSVGKVCQATIKDDSGQMILTLWNEQVEQVNVGDRVKVTNGYVSEFQGEKQLTAGKFGTLEIVKDDGSAAPSEAPKEDTPQEPTETPATEISEESVMPDDKEKVE